MNLLPFLLRTQASRLSIADIKKTENTRITYQRRIYAFAAVKTKEIRLETVTFCPDKRLCFSAEKSHPKLLRG